MDLYNLILKESKDIVINNGIGCLNIRDLANKCGISVGSIYNYFPSKSDLMVAVIQSIWQDIFKIENMSYNESFAGIINYIFETVSENLKKYPNFFKLHSLMLDNDEKNKGKQYMDNFIKNVEGILLKSIKRDENIRKNCFNEIFTEDIFVHYVFNLLLNLIFEKNSNCEPLLQLIKNCIY